MQPGQRGGRRTGQSHIACGKPGKRTGEQDRPRNPGFQYREIKPQNL